MTDKAPDFIRHTCPFRDECWQDVDERSLGKEAKRTGPLKTRPHPCGFEATRLEFCPKYRKWAQTGDEQEGGEISGRLVLAMTL